MESHKKLITLSVFLIASIIITGYFGYSAIKYDSEYIPIEPYDYSFDGNAKAISDVVIYHEFSTNEGNISFKIDSEIYSDEQIDIILELPRLADNIRIYKSDGKVHSDITDKTTITSYSTITKGIDDQVVNFTEIWFKNISPPPVGEAFYLVTYKMKLLPSGRFLFNDVGRFTGKEARLKFDLGKDFQCTEECISNPKNINQQYYSFDKELRLGLEYGSPESSFVLKGAHDYRTEHGLALGLLASFIGIIFVILKELIDILLYKILPK